MMPMTLPSAFDERTAGVAGLDGGVDLDQAGQLLGRAVGRVLRGDRLVERGDLARRRRWAHRPSRSALPTATTASPTATFDGVAERCGRQPGGAGQLEDRDVVRPVVAEHLRRVRLAVADVGDGDRRRAGDDVVVGEHDAVGGEDDAGARALRPVVADGRDDVDEARADSGDGGLLRRRETRGGRLTLRPGLAGARRSRGRPARLGRRDSRGSADLRRLSLAGRRPRLPVVQQDAADRAQHQQEGDPEGDPPCPRASAGSVRHGWRGRRRLIGSPRPSLRDRVRSTPQGGDPIRLDGGGGGAVGATTAALPGWSTMNAPPSGRRVRREDYAVMILGASATDAGRMLDATILPALVRPPGSGVKITA